MNKNDWNIFLNSLPADHRDLAIKFMERIQAIMNGDRSHLLDEMQRSHRRSDSNAERISELAIRLDIYEQQRADDVKAELERFAREQLSKSEADQFVATLYDLAARVEKLEGEERQSGAP